MATFEQVFLTMQTLQNFEGLRRDIRANLMAYQAQAARGLALADIVAVAHADAAQYLRRLAWVKSLYDDTVRGRPALVAGLAALGIAAADVLTLYTELLDAANRVAAANPTTVAQLNTACDTMLGQLPDHLTLW